eukprot:scaffold3339_cov103-Skeletonema_menzelii.AAC.2
MQRVHSKRPECRNELRENNLKPHSLTDRRAQLRTAAVSLRFRRTVSGCFHSEIDYRSEIKRIWYLVLAHGDKW